MKNTNDILPPADDRQVSDYMTEEDLEEYTLVYDWFVADKSGSVKSKEDKVYNALISTFSGLAENNKGSLDLLHRVKLSLFDSAIRDFNAVHLPPEQLVDTFTADDFRCSGSTAMGEVFRYIDKELRSSSPVVSKLRKNTPKFNFILVTDGQANDPAGLRESARKLLDSNRFYRNYCRVLVVFLGEDSDKATAVALADGHEENVVALSDDLVSLLAPILIGSTVTFTDGTHLTTTDDTSMADLAEQAKEREKDGTTSADELSDEKLRDELLRLMGKTA